MAMPRDVGVIDLMMGIPVSATNEEWHGFIKPLLMDRESIEQFKMPAQYMFKEIPHLKDLGDAMDFLVGHMDRHNVEMALVGLDERWESGSFAKHRHAHRFLLDCVANPNRGMEEVRRIKRLAREFPVKSVEVFPCGQFPQVPINDKKMYPLYATCVELDIPILINAGVPGPRVPMLAQHVEHIDEVCWFFPELKFVMRHGAEPWDALAVKLMLKYPNLYYSTSAFAPKYYPKTVIDFANTRGADKILYAGYFPMGLSLDRIFAELETVPFRDHVWPKFLRENAKRVFKIP